jgi:hypothetical protein
MSHKEKEINEQSVKHHNFLTVGMIEILHYKKVSKAIPVTGVEASRVMRCQASHTHRWRWLSALCASSPPPPKECFSGTRFC